MTPRLRTLIPIVALLLVAAAPASVAAFEGQPEGDWIASSQKIDFFRLMGGLELDGLVNGFSCSEPTGYDRGRVRADCTIRRDTDDFKARLGGRFKLDLRHKPAGARIVVRAVMVGFLKQNDARRSDLVITIKGGGTIEPGSGVAVVSLITKACAGSVCEKGRVSMPVPLENAAGRWTLDLSLDPTVDQSISGSAALRFADALVLSWDVEGSFDGRKERSKLHLIPNQPVRDRALSLVKLVPTDKGFAGKLAYSLFGQSGKTPIKLLPAPQP